MNTKEKNKVRLRVILEKIKTAETDKERQRYERIYQEWLDDAVDTEVRDSEWRAKGLEEINDSGVFRPKSKAALVYRDAGEVSALH